MELFEDLPSSNDLMIVKGKRTKRPKPSSSNSSNGGGSSNVGDFCNSTTSCTEISMSSEEDEDIANCLILLSGGSFPKNKPTIQETDGKVEIYVYECKTCNRTFPSFQALGGHRASHKRPKIDTDHKKSLSEAPSRDLEKENITILVPNKSVFAENNKTKTHECSICGSEFGSGQALGGHMRRHRSVPAGITSMKNGTHIENDDTEKSTNVFNLDLNLPAPMEDDRTENFSGFSSNQQRRLVFSTGVPLVDCHY